MAPDGATTFFFGVLGVWIGGFGMELAKFCSGLLLQAASGGSPRFSRTPQKAKTLYSECLTSKSRLPL